MQLTNRSIFISGGTSGIGLALVQQLAPKNTHIIVLARNLQKLNLLTNQYANVSIYQCALEDTTQVQTTLQLIQHQHPNISVVINNAGMQSTARFLDENFCFDSIATETATNLIAPIQICSIMLPSLIALNTPAAIVNIGSGLALFPKIDSAVYCATKAGLHNFSQSLRYQLEQTPIKIIEALLPLVDTPMTQGRGSHKITAQQAASEIIDGIQNNKTEIYVGKTKWIPLLARISPWLIARLMKSV